MVAVPVDGRLTSQNVLTGPLDGTAVIYIVSPGTETEGNSYQVSLDTLATFFTAASVGSPTFVISGATYNSVATDTRILVNKTVGSATSVVLLASASYSFPVLVKDLKGDADSNPITITFSGGQTMDGLASVIISNPYGYFWFNPLTAGGWYDAAY